MHRLSGSLAVAGFLCSAALLLGSRASAQWDLVIDIEAPPLNYLTTKDNNRVSRLVEQLQSKELSLEHTRDHGYLPSLLAALDIPQSSQVLVFSKTSLQVQHISRRNPRAIYFNDDTYVGWVRGSSLLEISTADPELGVAFYTVNMRPRTVKVERENYDCLGCHATSMTQGVPGHTVRSVYPDYNGKVNFREKSFLTDHSSPFSERWGGWYVTGLHGDMKHLGNAVLRGGKLDTSDNSNWMSLQREFDVDSYLSPHSDIVALMVLEHQTQMHNTITKADLTVRKWLYERAAGAVSEEAEQEWPIQLELVAKKVVDQMLYCDEAPLTSEVKGSADFSDEFSSRGPTDRSGRSLRQFDLQTRMFKYPCSYLIYSDAFDSLQTPLRDEIYCQLHAVLTGENQASEYAHLNATTGSEILSILLATKPSFAKTFQ